MQYSLSFGSGTVQYMFKASFNALDGLAQGRQIVLITDSNVAELHKDIFTAYKTIIIPAGEDNKSLEAVAHITAELVKAEVHKNHLLVGVGGGVVSDITGYVASVYMRGISFGFVPTTILSMADAAVGGKNGVNFGLHKNLLGTIRQPQFILYDTAFLASLPVKEWANGFAEIIKYACVFDGPLFDELEKHDLSYYRNDMQTLQWLIRKCVEWKNKIVIVDEDEKGPRKLLNFGHTAGHAIETLYHLPHGYAVGLGMIIACMVSERVAQLHPAARKRLIGLLKQYQLPAEYDIDADKVMQVLRMDKKRKEDTLDYVVLNNIGNPTVMALSFDDIQQAVASFAYAGNN